MAGTKTPFILCPTCLEQGHQRRTSVVAKEGTPCYWCKTLVKEEPCETEKEPTTST